MRIIFAVFIVSSSLLAQDREVPPPLGTPKPFSVPTSETFMLKNGMKVTLAQYGAAPIVTIRAVVSFGIANESADQVWMCRLMANLMKEGTATLTAQQVSNDAARMGGQIAINAGKDTSSAEIEVLTEFAPDAVKLVADVLQHPKLPESELERLRGDLLRQLAVRLASPGAQADRVFAATLYPAHPYGRLFPTESQLKSYGIGDVRKFYLDNVGAQRTHVYLVGRFDPAVKQTIESAFGDWDAGPPVRRNPPHAVAKESMTVVDRPGAVQSTLRLGLPVSVAPADADYIPMEVTDALLGGAFTSRITNNIREQKGYTYSPFSQVVTDYHAAYWEESADVTTKFTADSIREILLEVNRLRKDPPDAKELKGVQNLLAGIFVLQNSSNQGIIGQLSFVDLHGLSDDYLKSFVHRVNSVSQSDIQRIAESYLDPGKMTLIVVGDKAAIEQSLTPFQPKSLSH